MSYEMSPVGPKKACSYRGCKSTNYDPNPECFFIFPKDPQRFLQWCKLCKCDLTRNTTKYLCAKHFDHKKYISSNPRRKLLLSNAVPYEYTPDKENKADDSECIVNYNNKSGAVAVLEDESINEFGEQTDEIEETTNEDNFEVDNIIHDKNMYQNPNRKTLKRQAIEVNSDSDNSISSCSGNGNDSKLMKIENASSRSKININALELEEELIKESNISTFMFRNEEFVQMPKSFYVREKLKLVEEIQHYKNILNNLKNIINDESCRI